jgi:four helix bundle protein
MCDYRELLLWRQSQRLAEYVFRATESLTTSDQHDLARRLRDAAIVIPQQIAEHYSQTRPGLLVGVRRARRSLLRLQQLVDLAGKLRYWPARHTTWLIRHTRHLQRHLRAFSHSLEPVPHLRR